MPKVLIANKQKFLFTIVVGDSETAQVEEDRKEGPTVPHHTLFAQVTGGARVGSGIGGAGGGPSSVDQVSVGRRRWFAIGKVTADRAEVLTYNWATSLTERLSSFVEQHAGWARQRDVVLQRILYQVRTTRAPTHNRTRLWSCRTDMSHSPNSSENGALLPLESFAQAHARRRIVRDARRWPYARSTDPGGAALPPRRSDAHHAQGRRREERRRCFSLLHRGTPPQLSF